MDAFTNLRMLRDTGRPLGIACQRCNHRALVEYSQLICRHGLMRKLADIRFRCRNCSSRSVEFMVFWRRSEMQRFMRD
jgi:DNA-directed RNA polymerase subunit RPC12/RpoP